MAASRPNTIDDLFATLRRLATSRSCVATIFSPLSLIVPAPLGMRHRFISCPDIPFQGRTSTDGCVQPEGCFFCSNYRAHADDLDIRKLVSARFCINRTRHLSATDEHFHSLFEPVVQRINDVLEQIRNHSAEADVMVRRITSEVEVSGHLDVYWEREMETLIGLGLVSE